MKTNVLSIIVLATSLLSALFNPSTLGAQNCPGKTIKNSGPCTIVVDYSSDCNLGTTCNAQTGVTIAAGASFAVPATCAPVCGTGFCRLTVTLQQVAGTTVGPVTVTSINQSGSYSPPSNCPTAGGTVTWGLNQVIIQ